MKRLYILLISLSFISISSCIYKSVNKKEFDISNYGAVADGITDNAVAIKKAINACEKAGGGKVIVPANGVFMTGPFDLTSNMELHIEAGATLLANPDTAVYQESAFRENLGEGTIWIGGKDLSNVSITGLGTIDGNGIKFMGQELEDSFELLPFNIKDSRPHVLTLINVKKIRIEDVTFKNSAYWTVHLIGCDDGVIRGITINNSLKIRNSDGIDLDHCKNIRISDCHIQSGDDSICLKNRREFAEYGKCENIVITNCLMSSRSCAFKIGSENMDTIQNVTVTNCTILASNRGIGIQNRDEGVVQNILFSNIIVESQFFSDVWWGKSEPIYITAYKRANINHKDANWRFPKGATQGFVGEINNIVFRNILCNTENGIFISAESKEKIKNILLDGITINLNRVTDYQGGIYDRRPCEGEGLLKAKTSAFYIENVTDVITRNCDIRFGNNPPQDMGELIYRSNN